MSDDHLFDPHSANNERHLLKDVEALLRTYDDVTMIMPTAHAISFRIEGRAERLCIAVRPLQAVA